MTKEERQAAIMRGDYEYLYNNESDDIKKQRIIDLYFQSQNKKKIINPNKIIEKEIFSLKKYWNSIPRSEWPPVAYEFFQLVKKGEGWK